MKKFALILSILAVAATTNAFAANCESDLQFHIGGEGLWGYGDNEHFAGDRLDGGAFTILIENFNMFPLSVGGGDFLSLGFMESFEGSFGGMTKWHDGGRGDWDESKALGFNLLISPAFGIKFGKIVKLQMYLGLDFRYEEFGVKWDGGSETVKKLPMLGIATGCEAKFLPNGFLSPVVGIRYAWTGMPEYYYNDDYTGTDDDKVSDDCYLHTFLFSIGLSINFGKK